MNEQQIQELAKQTVERCQRAQEPDSFSWSRLQPIIEEAIRTALAPPENVATASLWQCMACGVARPILGDDWTCDCDPSLPEEAYEWRQVLVTLPAQPDHFDGLLGRWEMKPMPDSVKDAEEEEFPGGNCPKCGCAIAFAAHVCDQCGYGSEAYDEEGSEDGG